MATPSDSLGSWSTDQEPTLALDFAPELPARYRWHFYEVAVNIAFLPLDAQVSALVHAATTVQRMRETSRSDGQDGAYADLTKVIAAIAVFRDLLQFGWKVRLSGPRVQLIMSPTDNDVLAAKARVRDSLNFERRESLSSSAVREFVRSMERTRIVDDKPRTILSLVADGSRLAHTLQGASRLDSESRRTKLERAIRPYLQLVTSEARDQFTGYRLMDIWRYFRLTWSIPYRSTPGRNMHYLIRDAGQPCHPVMGIAALGNCVIGLKCRDDVIGWTPDAMAESILAARAHGPIAYKEALLNAAHLLSRHLESGISAIELTDIATPNAVANPTLESVRAIEQIALEAAEERYRHLRNESNPAAKATIPVADIPPAATADRRVNRSSSEQLFRRKRAAKLAALLRAKLILSEAGVDAEPEVGVPNLLWSDERLTSPSERGRSAVRTILNAHKETKIGSAMMEIIVCGAVPPYNYLLGGKLVAMLLTSTEVIKDYRRRYGRTASTIASRVAGCEVTRPADLVFLGTTSLYVARSDQSSIKQATTAGAQTPQGKRKASSAHRPSSASQYNRIVVPGSIAGRDGQIRYDCIGMTEGYGSVHFSSDTRALLEELDTLAHNARRINSVFGEGTSPRMRKIRQGISLLGLDERFLIHGQNRLVYAVRLAHNADDYLRGSAESPHYILPQTAPKNVTKSIARHWIRRWLCSRVDYQPALQNVAQFEPRSVRLSNEFRAVDDEGQS